MPLYWTTDKIIDKKYRLKKPIPVHEYEIDGNEYTYLGIKIGSFDYGYYDDDDVVIEYICKHITDFKKYLEDLK